LGRVFFHSPGAALSRHLRDVDARPRFRARRRHACRDATRPRAPSRDARHAHGRTFVTMSIEPIVGRYLNLDVGGASYRISFEEAGRGVPLLCLATAGADSRQYRHVMMDGAITSRYRGIAFDMPYHGRSNPPDGW